MNYKKGTLYWSTLLAEALAMLTNRVAVHDGIRKAEKQIRSRDVSKGSNEILPPSLADYPYIKRPTELSDTSQHIFHSTTLVWVGKLS